MAHGARRRQYLVDVRVQGPFLAKVGLIWAGGILLLCLLLHYLADEELGRSFFTIHNRIRDTWQILLPAVALSGGVSFLVTIVATLLFALRESNRVGGPVYKFGLLFRGLAEGDLDATFRFRRGDILVDLGERYREALLATGFRVRSVQDGIRGAEEALGSLRRRLELLPLPPGDVEAVDDALRRLAEAREHAHAFRNAGDRP